MDKHTYNKYTTISAELNAHPGLKLLLLLELSYDKQQLEQPHESTQPYSSPTISASLSSLSLEATVVTALPYSSPTLS